MGSPGDAHARGPEILGSLWVWAYNHTTTQRMNITIIANDTMGEQPDRQQNCLRFDS